MRIFGASLTPTRMPRFVQNRLFVLQKKVAQEMFNYLNFRWLDWGIIWIYFLKIPRAILKAYIRWYINEEKLIIFLKLWIQIQYLNNIQLSLPAVWIGPGDLY